MPGLYRTFQGSYTRQPITSTKVNFLKEFFQNLLLSNEYSPKLKINRLKICLGRMVISPDQFSYPDEAGRCGDAGYY